MPWWTAAFHEQGVDELEVELQNIVDGWAPPPVVNIRRFRSHLLLQIYVREWRT